MWKKQSEICEYRTLISKLGRSMRLATRLCAHLSGPPFIPLSMGTKTLHDSRPRQQPRAQRYRASKSCMTLNVGGLASIVVPQDVMASAQRMKGITIAKMRDMTCWGIMRGDFFREENERAPDICPAS